MRVTGVDAFQRGKAMRDHTKLKVFVEADDLTLAVYRTTSIFPKAEMFGLTSQIRRAAVSVCSNIVEGCARRTEADYMRFMEIAFGSAREMEYQISLSSRLGYIPETEQAELADRCNKISRMLGSLLSSFERKPRADV